MNDNHMQRGNKYHSILSVVSLVSLVFMAIACLDYFIVYDWEFGTEFDCPGFEYIFLMLFEIAPIILLVLYAFHFINKPNGILFVALACACVAAGNFFELIIRYLIKEQNSSFNGIVSHLIMTGVFAVAALSILTDSQAKLTTVIVAVAFASFLTYINISTYIYYLKGELYLYSLVGIMRYLGSFGMYASLIMIAVKSFKPSLKMQAN